MFFVVRYAWIRKKHELFKLYKCVELYSIGCPTESWNNAYDVTRRHITNNVSN